MHLYWTASLLQMKSVFRIPAFWIPVLVFPPMLYAMFASGGTGAEADYPMASFAVFGVIGVALFQFGVSIAQDRETYWERYLRTLPGAFGPRMMAQLVNALVFSFLVVVLVLLAAILLSEPTLSLTGFISLGLWCLLIAVPFVLMGIALGYWASSKSAVGIANLLYLPLAYFGGLWVPPQHLPDFAAKISPYTPTRNAGEIVWAIVGQQPIPSTAVLWLLGFSLAFSILAYIGYTRDENRRYA